MMEREQEGDGRRGWKVMVVREDWMGYVGGKKELERELQKLTCTSRQVQTRDLTRHSS
jgi:hypothetical protein